MGTAQEPTCSRDQRDFIEGEKTDADPSGFGGGGGGTSAEETQKREEVKKRCPGRPKKRQTITVTFGWQRTYQGVKEIGQTSGIRRV